MTGRKTAVIIPAAGVSTRMGSGIKKQYLMCEGLPVLIRTVRAFCAVSGVAQIIAVAPAADLSFVRGLLDSYGLSHVQTTAGGAIRRDSVRNGLALVEPDADFVLVHDGARPFVSKEVIEEVLQALENGADCALPGVSPKNTIRTAEKTLDRSLLFEVQTPQGFRAEVLRRAHQKALKDGFEGTDDISLAERLGCKAVITRGDYANIKITTKEDLPMTIRIGTGYDVHRLVEGRRLMLGCVEIPYEKGLLGHSDADVLCHAIADAILGAAALGDIGKLFPDTAAETEGMSGTEILSKTKDFVALHGFTICNVDATLIAQKPKISPYTEQMRRCIAEALDLEVSAVSVKATTEEGLGFTGNGSAMAAQAVCTLK
ncbi:MAG: 2-C-methyl-D-erythritol 4-phosphate cytidylyltransferase [Firmicutes bacterium]|nr:2-C-methyl-D-erythritol 4-phosphate cytidylyltransferase [Bacillota bacterium]